MYGTGVCSQSPEQYDRRRVLSREVNESCQLTRPFLISHSAAALFPSVKSVIYWQGVRTGLRMIFLNCRYWLNGTRPLLSLNEASYTYLRLFFHKSLFSFILLRRWRSTLNNLLYFVSVEYLIPKIGWFR